MSPALLQAPGGHRHSKAVDRGEGKVVALLIAPPCRLIYLPGAAASTVRQSCGDDVTIPNFITIFRFLLVPGVMLALLDGEMGWALALFAVAGISDGLDGFIARQFNQRSALGAFLDPIADKLLLVTVFVMLGYMDELPLWLVVAAVSRDALIVTAVLVSYVMGHPVAVKPLLVSKANTACQIVLVIAVLTELALGDAFGPVRPVLVVLCGLLTVASAAAYLVQWLRHMGRHEEAGD